MLQINTNVFCFYIKCKKINVASNAANSIAIAGNEDEFKRSSCVGQALDGYTYSKAYIIVCKYLISL